jgi:hypothetical protein
VPLPSEFKELSSTILLPLKTPSMTMWTKATKDTLKKGTTPKEPSRTYVIITPSLKAGADTSLTSLKDVERQFLLSPTLDNRITGLPIDDSRKSLLHYELK